MRSVLLYLDALQPATVDKQQCCQKLTYSLAKQATCLCQALHARHLELPQGNRLEPANISAGVLPGSQCCCLHSQMVCCRWELTCARQPRWQRSRADSSPSHDERRKERQVSVQGPSITTVQGAGLCSQGIRRCPACTCARHGCKINDRDAPLCSLWQQAWRKCLVRKPHENHCNV